MRRGHAFEPELADQFPQPVGFRASVFDAAFDSSTMAAFCWVTWSIWLTAVLTSARPVDCSRAAVAIASMCSLIVTT